MEMIDEIVDFSRSGLRSPRRKRVMFLHDSGQQRTREAVKKKKYSPKAHVLKKRILCHCLFPHFMRIYGLFDSLSCSKETKRPLKRQKSIEDELDRLRQIKPNANIELFYNSDMVLGLIKENASGKGHMKCCTSQKEPSPETIVSSVVVLSKNSNIDIEKVKEEMHEDATFSDFYTVLTEKLLKEAKRKDKRTYEVPENGKSIRAALTYFMEKLMRENLKDAHLRLEMKQKRKLIEKCNAMLTRPETRAMSAKRAKCYSRGSPSNIINKIEELRTLYSWEFIKVSEQFDFILDRIVSIRNELIREPGKPKHHVVSVTKKDIQESVRSALTKIEEVKVYGYIHGILEIWIDEQKIRKQKSKLEDDIRSIVGEICKIRYIRHEPVDTKIRPGNKLHRTRNERSYGTLGTFAESENDVVGITISHVVLGIEKPLVKDIDGWHEVGDVIQLNDPSKDLVSFVHIKPTHRDRIELQIEKDEKLLTSVLYEANDNLADHRQIVYKKGATSAWTKGIVKLDKQSPDEQGLVIEQFGPENEQFVQKGDSGSAIIRFDPNDPDNEKVEVISIVSGALEEDNSPIGVHSCRLKEPLHKLSEVQDANYQLR